MKGREEFLVICLRGRSEGGVIQRSESANSKGKVLEGVGACSDSSRAGVSITPTGE